MKTNHFTSCFRIVIKLGLLQNHIACYCLRNAVCLICLW